MNKEVILTALVLLCFTNIAFAKDYGDYFVTKYGTQDVRANYVESASDSDGNLKTLKIKYATITPDAVGVSGSLSGEKVGKAFINKEADVLGIKSFEGITYVSGSYSEKHKDTIGWSHYLYAKLKYGDKYVTQWSIRIEMDENFVIKDIVAEVVPLTDEFRKSIEESGN